MLDIEDVDGMESCGEWETFADTIYALIINDEVAINVQPGLGVKVGVNAELVKVGSSESDVAGCD